MTRGSARAAAELLLGFDDAELAGSQFAGKLVHGLDPAQMDGYGGHVPHQRDRLPAGQVGRCKNAVGQHIDVKILHTKAGGHNFHRLLHAEHLAAVGKQGLPAVHHQHQRTVKQVLSHEYSPAQR